MDVRCDEYEVEEIRKRRGVIKRSGIGLGEGFGIFIASSSTLATLAWSKFANDLLIH